MSAVSGAPYDARAVANAVLDLAWERNISLTQMQVLKIIYFAYGWYLVTTGKRLVVQDFQAWDYGPVIKVVRDSFKRFGKREITEKAERLNIFTGEFEPVEEIGIEEDRKFIRGIFESYHVYGAWELSDMTHEPGSPWDQVWNSRGAVGNLGLKLRDEHIHSHFGKMAKARSFN